MSDLTRLRALRKEEDIADLHAKAGDFRGASLILRAVNQALAELYGPYDPQRLRQLARQDLGHWA